MSEPITPDALADARALLGNSLQDCPHCGGFTEPDPRRGQVRHPPVICLDADRTAWYVRCFSCWACCTSTASAREAVQRWNRRVGGVAARGQMLPLVDVQKHATRAGVSLTPEVATFAADIQIDVIRLNRVAAAATTTTEGTP